MPCYEDPHAWEGYDNKRKFGFEGTNAQLLQELACQMGRLLDAHGLLGKASPLVRKWITSHKEHDAKVGRAWKKVKRERR